MLTLGNHGRFRMNRRYVGFRVCLASAGAAPAGAGVYQKFQDRIKPVNAASRLFRIEN